jgi:squalene synthase HpnC
VTIRACALDREPFVRLITANRVDQELRRLETWGELLRYCALSANPVGELVLRIFGQATPDRITRSDRICSALQVIEHCQDVAEDFERGRIYLPAEDLSRQGCAEAALGAATAGPALRAVLRLELARSRRLLVEGEPLLDELGWTARLAVAGFVAGGHAAIDGIERVDHDVLGRRPRVARLDWVVHLARLLWRHRRPAH